MRNIYSIITALLFFISVPNFSIAQSDSHASKANSIVDTLQKLIDNGNTKESFEFLQKHQDFFEKTSILPSEKLKFILLAAKTYSLRLNYELALQEYEYALAFSEENCTNREATLALLEMAEFQRKVSDFDRAEEYLNEAYKRIDKQKDHYNLAYYYNRLAAIYTERNMVTPSVINSKKCIEIAKKYNFYKLLGLSYNEIGFVYSNVPQFEMGRKYFDTSVVYSLKGGFMRDWGSTVMNQFRHFMRDNRPLEAEAIMEPLFPYAQKYGWQRILEEYYMNKAWIRREKGDSLEYWKYTSRFMIQRNHNTEEANRNKIFELQKIYDQTKNMEIIEAQKKAIEIDKDLVKRKKKENVFILSILLVLVLFVVALGLLIIKIKGTSKALASEKNKLNEINVVLKDSIERNDILVKEIHHRVKNNMQIISSILGIQESYEKNPAIINVFKDARSRITSMALVHQNLYETDNYKKVVVKNYFEELFSHISSTFNKNNENIKIKLEFTDVELGVDTLVPLALIANEWLTNAYKYAFDKGEAGEIFFSIKVEDSFLICMFQDNGKGIENVNTTKKGVGSLMIEQLTNQLFGTIEINNSGKGLKYTLTIPLKSK